MKTQREIESVSRSQQFKVIDGFGGEENVSVDERLPVHLKIPQSEVYEWGCVSWYWREAVRKETSRQFLWSLAKRIEREIAACKAGVEQMAITAEGLPSTRVVRTFEMNKERIRRDALFNVSVLEAWKTLIHRNGCIAPMTEWAPGLKDRFRAHLDKEPA